MDLDAIEARADAATEGPLRIEVEEFGRVILNPADRIVASVSFTNDAQEKADAELIAAAFEDVPALVARVRELEGELDLLRRELQAARGERVGTWDTWEEHVTRKQATPAEPPVKPRLSLEEARLQAARARAHGTD